MDAKEHMKITTTVSYTIRFQVSCETGYYGTEYDTLQEALVQWDIAMSNEPKDAWIIEGTVTKVIK